MPPHAPIIIVNMTFSPDIEASYGRTASLVGDGEREVILQRGGWVKDWTLTN